MKRVVIISDLHCGARTGLTPPSWQYPSNSNDETRLKFSKIQFEMWDWYKRTIEALKPIDVLLVNGDCIDGKGERSGTTEIMEPDRFKQGDMASECILEAEAKHIVMTYGTPYHTGVSEDFEHYIAEKVKAEKIGGQEWVDVNGLIFDMKHFVGRSVIPHGRHTAINRDQLWNMYWAEADMTPRGDVFIRSHVHYFVYSGYDSKLMIATPGLQAFKTKFGMKIPVNQVDIGLISFDVESKTEYTWKSHLLKPVYQRVEALKL